MNDAQALQVSALEPFRHRLLVVEDDEFIRSMLVESLIQAGCEVHSASTVPGALEILSTFEPHAVLCDLNLGEGPTGIDLLLRVQSDYPWIAQVILSSHRSVELAVGKSLVIPKQAIYLVKGSINSSTEILEAVKQAISLKAGIGQHAQNVDDGIFELTHSQAQILRYLALGYSNLAIAEARGTSLRAAEAMVRRTFAALAIDPDPSRSQRVLAVNLWQQGKVFVK